jgi:hypothetical protein
MRFNHGQHARYATPWRRIPDSTELTRRAEDLMEANPGVSLDLATYYLTCGPKNSDEFCGDNGDCKCEVGSSIYRHVPTFR